MIPKHELLRVAKELLDKSKAGQVRWQPVSSRGEAFANVVNAMVNRRSRQFPTAFSVSLPHSKIYIEYCSPTSEPDYVVFDVCAENGTVVGSLFGHDGETNWDLLRQLYETASRLALGWDIVLEDIDRALEQNNAIGDDVTQRIEDATSDPFFIWAAGSWLLKYTPKGGRTHAEAVTIHSNGTYDVKGEPRFALTNVDYDTEKGTVSFNKTYLETHPAYRPERLVHHREELKIVSHDAMLGHRSGVPEHILDYRRQ